MLAAGLAPAASAQTSSRPLRASKASGSPKKGHCIGPSQEGWSDKLEALNCKWYYTWTPNVPRDAPRNVSFVPMIWEYRGTAESVLKPAKIAKNAGCEELLGFNEPDQKEQADMSVEEALEIWPLLEKTKLRLGSPACVHPDNEWMTLFLEEVKKRKLRVDFICVHSYSGADPQSLIRRMKAIEKRYNRPIWITEFAVGDWKAKNVAENQFSPKDVLTYMKEVLPLLDRLDCVERYAWFSAKPNSPSLGTSALFDDDGKLTPLGECYRDA